MNQGKTVFAQLMSFVSFYEFSKCVDRYQGDYRVRSFTCRQQFLIMSFAQLSYRESLRDIEVCLKALSSRLYHSGLNRSVSRSTIADANENRDWRIYADFAQILILEARDLYKTDNEFLQRIDQVAYALDSTTIDLSLGLFPWARFRRNKGAVKLHTLMDLNGSIPTFIDVTQGLTHDIKFLDVIPFEPGAVYVADMAYIGYEKLYNIHRSQAFFITRCKANMACRRIYSRKVDKTTGLKYDQSVALVNPIPKKLYPEQLRRIKYTDHQTNKTFIFLTNNFEHEAITIVQLYKERWKIELFFKWIKQNLRIKAFYGHSPNAVQVQVWIAISTYLLVSIIKKKLNLEQSLYTLLQAFNLSLFERIPINKLFEKQDYTLTQKENPNQLNLFEL